MESLRKNSGHPSRGVPPGSPLRESAAGVRLHGEVPWAGESPTGGGPEGLPRNPLGDHTTWYIVDSLGARRDGGATFSLINVHKDKFVCRRSPACRGCTREGRTASIREGSCGNSAQRQATWCTRCLARRGRSTVVRRGICFMRWPSRG